MLACGIVGSVKKRYDGHAVGLDTVVRTVRKAFEKAASRIPVVDGTGFGEGDERFDSALDRTSAVQPALGLIPRHDIGGAAVQGIKAAVEFSSLG